MDQGQIVTKHRFPKFYVGLLKGKNKRKMFTTALEPSSYYFPEFGAVIGPFKTKRGAKWATENWFNWSTVAEAEMLAKRAGL